MTLTIQQAGFVLNCSKEKFAELQKMPVAFCATFEGLDINKQFNNYQEFALHVMGKGMTELKFFLAFTSCIQPCLQTSDIRDVRAEFAADALTLITEYMMDECGFDKFSFAHSTSVAIDNG